MIFIQHTAVHASFLRVGWAWIILRASGMLQYIHIYPIDESMHGSMSQTAITQGMKCTLNCFRKWMDLMYQFPSAIICPMCNGIQWRGTKASGHQGLLPSHPHDLWPPSSSWRNLQRSSHRFLRPGVKNWNLMSISRASWGCRTCYSFVATRWTIHTWRGNLSWCTLHEVMVEIKRLPMILWAVVWSDTELLVFQIWWVPDGVHEMISEPYQMPDSTLNCKLKT